MQDRLRIDEEEIMEDMNLQQTIKLKLGCKECGEITFMNVSVPSVLLFWKCPTCGDSMWNPMLIGVLESDLQVLKPIKQVIQDEDVRWTEEAKKEWQEIKQNYSFEVGV